MRGEPKFWAVIVATLVVVYGLNLLFYEWTDADCRARGGHTEMVWGGRLPAWTCSGATQP